MTEYSYLGLRLPVEMHDRLRADSEANERSVSQTVRLAVRQYLADADDRLTIDQWIARQDNR